ncbi:MAG: LptF/LptG family permease [Crocinitomicaceae bacterium]|nr:LptF/LptG family permease [Crocinitomicaceae bacterium]
MKKLHTFTIKSFVGPFAITFAISIFLLVMQFFWKYIDDLMGKGLDTFIILELLFFVSASIIPLALPLAVLISSIMTLGNLAENNELTALKASGLSLYRILFPLFSLMVVLSIGTFYFSNYALPVANLKWRWIIYDIQQQKPTFSLDAGEFYYNFDGYAIKAAKIDKENSKLEDIVIYDHSAPRNISVIRAEKGHMYNSQDEKYLFLELMNGRVYESVNPSDGKNARNMPFRKSKFEKATIRFDLSGFSTNRSNQEIFKNNVEMLNIYQLENALDSVADLNQEILQSFSKNIKNQHEYFIINQEKYGLNKGIDTVKSKANDISGKLVENNDKINKIHQAQDAKLAEMNNKPIEEEEKDFVPTVANMEKIVNPSLWTDTQWNKTIQSSAVKLRNRKNELVQYIQIMNNRKMSLDKYKMEWHRKFTLSFSIMVLFLIGAPLGAIIRKGGLGMPIVVSVFLFIIYYVLMITGEKMVKSQVLEPWLGMWLSTFILAPLSIFILVKASNDSQIFRKESILKVFGFLRIFKRLNLRKNPRK